MKRFIAALTGIAVALPGAAAQGKELPNYDALAQSTAKLPAAPKSARAGQATSVIPSLSARSGGVTSLIRVPSARAVGVDQMSTVQSARMHLAQNASLVEASKAAVIAAPVTGVSTMGRGLTIVSFEQNVGGIPVFRSSVKVALNPRNEPVAIMGSFSPHANPEAPAAKFLANLDERQAIAKAYADVTGETLFADVLESEGMDGGRFETYVLGNPAAALTASFSSPARVKQVFFPLPEQLVPAYQIEVDLSHVAGDSTDSDMYMYVVSARDGSVLFRHNLKAHAEPTFSYRTYADATPPYTPWEGPSGIETTPHPTGIPDGFAAPYKPQALVTLQNAPFSKNDPWLNAGASWTSGNNVDAYADIFAPNGFSHGDVLPTTTGTRTFDYAYDPTINPDQNLTQIQAATVNLFYVNNWLHDFWYDRGFDEASGNAQASNYGRGGVEGDALRVEAQDSSGLNNANMSTGSDGNRPRMQMYIFSGVQQGKHVYVAELDKTFTALGTANFGPRSFNLTREVLMVDDGVAGTGTTLTDGCSTPFANAAAVAGKTVMIDRGGCEFQVKVNNAQRNGAAGVIIANNAAGAPINMGPSTLEVNLTTAIPSVMMTQADSGEIKTALAAGPVNVRLQRDPTKDYESTVDNGIVAHEWGHYLSNRLVQNAAGLSNNQGRSMGEGWSDFVAMMMIVREVDRTLPGNDHYQGVYAPAEFSLRADPQAAYWGIRRLPYSTDFAKNALTFKHIMNGVPLPTTHPVAFGADGATNAAVHSSGEVWATMLWECYTSLLNAHPFAEAQKRMAEYLVGGFKLTPAAPTMLEARDALLAATLAMDEADYHRFTAAFARRGAGVGAVGPARTSTTHAGVVESFVNGGDVAIVDVTLDDSTESCDHDGVLDNGETGKITVTLRNAGTVALEHTTATITSPTPGVTFANGGVITFPTIALASSASASVDVMLDGVTDITALAFTVNYGDTEQVTPAKTAVDVDFLGNTDDAVATTATETVEANTSPWVANTVLTGGGTNASFNFFRALTTGAPDDHSFYGPNPPAPADVTLTSPAFHVAATGDFSFTFQHRFGFERNAANTVFYDGGVIELSEDGGLNWVDIGNKATPTYNGVITTSTVNPLSNRPAYVSRSAGFPNFVPVTVNLGTAYAGKTVQIRFRMGGDENSVDFGWNWDNMVVSGITNTPFNGLVAGQNQCATAAILANAGADATVNEGASGTLSGSASGRNPAVSYAWVQTSGPAATLTGANTATAGFTAPQVAAETTLVFELTVTDAFGHSDTDSVTITVQNLNADPTAVINVSGIKNPGETITLDGSASSDPDNETLTYAWKQLSGTTVQLSSTTAKTVTFVAPKLIKDKDQSLMFELTVTDGSSASAKATTTVIITKKKDTGGCSSTGGSPASLLFPLLGLAAWAFASRRRRAS